MTSESKGITFDAPISGAVVEAQSPATITIEYTISAPPEDYLEKQLALFRRYLPSARICHQVTAHKDGSNTTEKVIAVDERDLERFVALQNRGDGQ